MLRLKPRKAQHRYEHTSNFGIHVPDAALDLARQSATAGALRRSRPDREPTEKEIDEIVRQGSPPQPPKRCNDCGEKKVQWYEQLPGPIAIAVSGSSSGSPTSGRF